MPPIPQRVRCLLAAFALLLSTTITADAATAGSFSHDGRLRTYSLHIPPGQGRQPVALVVALHGGGGNGELNAEQTGFNALADREGFIVVHPDGTGRRRPLLNALGKGRLYTWNAGNCCGYAAQQDIDDVGFLRSLVRVLSDRYPIDPARIYATGLSNGGMMSYRLACDASDLFAAIGVVAGTQTASHCQPAQAVSVLHIHGSADRNVLPGGGNGDKALDKAPKPPVREAIDFWTRANGTDRSPRREVRSNIEREIFDGGRDDSSVEFLLIKGAGHAWPGGRRLFDFLDEPSQELSATETVWAFFKAYPKRRDRVQEAR